MTVRKRRLKGLSEHSVFYKEKAAVYETFSKAEDAPERILKALLPKIKNKFVLDIGCGTGKYAQLLAPYIKEYYGVDISASQLSIAKKKVRNVRNVRLVCTDATKMKLPEDLFDIAVAFWAVSPIAGWDRKKRAIAATLHALKSDSSLYLIENDSIGMFEKIRGAHRREETAEYNRWVRRQGFKMRKRIKTYFEFSSKAQARKVFSTIWGSEVGHQIKGKRVSHQVVIFEKRKA